MATWSRVSDYRGLVIDIENKPGTFGGGDFTHSKVTAFAGMFLDRKRPRAWVCQRDDFNGMRRDAEEFRALWARAHFIVGHNVRRHDRKLLDGHYTMLDLPLLPKRRIVDTYHDQPRMSGLSRSLENLAARWGCPIQKLHLSEQAWELAYDGVPEYVEVMRRRVTTDVQINAWLFHELVRRNLLEIR